MRLQSILVCGTVLLGATTVTAQEVAVPAGAPPAGTQVQLRYTNPSQTNAGAPTSGAAQGSSVMTGTGSNPYQAIQERRAAASGQGAEGGEAGEAGEESAVRDPFSSSAVVGVGTMTQRGPIFLAGADIYRGITPTAHDTLPHIERYRNAASQTRRPNQLTWIGFQPFDEFTRVFVQTGRSSAPTIQRSPDGLTLTLRLPNTHISLSNFARSLETARFPTAVQRVHATRGPSGATDVVIELNADVEYQMETFSGGAEYIFLDFRDRE